jgi:diguanylate cyclase (GGDEF)-like protein
MAGVRALFAIGNWLSRTLTRKFLLLLGAFLVLQIGQLAAGVREMLHFGEDAAAINEAGRQRTRALLLANLAGEAAEAGAWNAGGHRLYRETIAAADAYFAGRGRHDHAPRIAAALAVARADWQRELRPLLEAAEQVGDRAASRAAAERYRALARDKLGNVEAIVTLREAHARDGARALALLQCALLAAGLLLGLAGFIMARRIVSRPLRRLIEATNAIAAGAYDRRVAVTSRDELGELAGTFNRMAVAVGETTSRLRALTQAAAAVTSSLSLKEILDEVLRRGAGLTGARAACIALFDPRAGLFEERVTYGLSERFVKNMSFRPGGLAEEAFLGNATVASDDHPGTRHKLSRLAREEGIRSFICIPLVSGDRRLGVVYFYRGDRDCFSDDEISVLRTFASLAAGAIANARAHEETLDLAITDKLTGLRNRRLFDQHLEDETAQARREGRPLALLLADIDHFKRINDTYGHAAGDLVLQSVGRLILAQSRQSDLAARIGGEEFAVLLPDTGAGGAKLAAERIRHAIAGEPPHLLGYGEVKVTLSFGIATFGKDGVAPQTLFERADQALYMAKREGRNRIRLYDETLKARLDRDPAHLVELLAQGEECIPAIVTAISVKAPFFRGHSEAVAEATQRLAGALGFSPGVREALRLAALLHDMGMITVPDEVLAKKGGLGAGEWALVKGHAAAGAEFLERVPTLRHLAPMVRHHHERWDGGGYPDGLRGEAIPYLARVLAVADAYGAIVSGWVGRSAEPESRALQALRAGAGTQFDPEIVAALARPARPLELAA